MSKFTNVLIAVGAGGGECTLLTLRQRGAAGAVSVVGLTDRSLSLGHLALGAAHEEVPVGSVVACAAKPFALYMYQS